MRQSPASIVRLCLVCFAFAMSAPPASAAPVTQDTKDNTAGSSSHPLPPVIAPIASFSNKRVIEIKGQAQARLRVSVEGGAATVRVRADSKGRFSVDVLLKRNQLNALAVYTTSDSGMNSSVMHVPVTQDSEDPQIIVEHPVDGTLFHQSPVHIAGRVVDALSGVANINCATSVANLAGADFDCEVPLANGSHSVKVWASDRAGNVNLARVRVIVGPQLPGGDRHRVMVNADLDRDGRPDVVQTLFLDGQVAILLANADGTLQPERRVAVGPYPSSVAVADMDGDGWLDLITTHYTTRAVALHYGRSDGSFVAGPKLEVDAFPTSVLAADLNADGRLDLITAHMRNREVHVHLARGHQRFATRASVKVGEGPVALAIADVDADGKLDLATANFVSGDASLLLGRGGGRFHSEQRIALGNISGPAAIALADLDMDGLVDLATANYGDDSVAVALNTGAARFQAAQRWAVGSQPIAIRVAEVTGDGRPDLITVNAGSSDYSVLAGQAGGTLAAAQQVQRITALASTFLARPLRVGSLTQFPPNELSADANMPNPFGATARQPAAGLPAPADRVGLTFGQDTSHYGTLFGPEGMKYVPLATAMRAGITWVRVDANRSNFFGPDAWMTYAGYSQFVDRLLQAGFNVHIIITDFRWWPPVGIPYPADFYTDPYLQDYTQFAGELAQATYRPGRVMFEVWNEPDLFGLFWSPQRPNVSEAALFARMLTQVTEAIHTKAPGSIVISGGLTSESASYVAQFLPAYTQRIAGKPAAAVDRFGFHPYPSSIDTLTRFRTELDAAGFASAPIDISEVGGWWSSRGWVAALNAAILLHAIDNDVPHVNFWSALSTNDDLAMAGFMDPAETETDGCRGSAYANLPAVAGYRCHPSMYMAAIFNRIARERVYQGAFFDPRASALPGAVPEDSRSGVRALKFESDEDVVVAVYTLDHTRGDATGRNYSIKFPIDPSFVISNLGIQPDAAGRYRVSHAEGPAYFVFSKTKQPPTHTVHAHAVCQDGSPARRGQLQLWHTVWPTEGAAVPLDWQTPGAQSASSLTAVSRQLPLFRSNMYVAAEAADGSGRFLTVRSTTRLQGGAGAPSATAATFFDPPTPMVRLDAPSSSSSVFQVDYLAPPEWCTE